MKRIKYIEVKFYEKNYIYNIFLTILVISFIFAKYNVFEKRNVKIPILLYHDFVLELPNDSSIDLNYMNTPQSFEENVKTLLKNGYTIMSLKELNKINENEILPEKPIIITFDDGYYSNYEYIFPILKKYNITSSIFITTDKIGKEENGKKYLGWDECLEMQRSELVDIFSHSKNHLFYNKVPIKDFYNDVLESQKIIEEKLGKKDFKAFAYPYGAYTNETVTVLILNGIDMQLYDLGINNLKNFNKSYVKRINIPFEMTGEEIIKEINDN